MYVGPDHPMFSNRYPGLERPGFGGPLAGPGGQRFENF